MKVVGVILLAVVWLAACGADEEPVPAGQETTPSAPSAPSEPSGPSEPADPAGLESVKADVETAAVSLESFYRGSPYPRTTAEVVETLGDAGLTLAAGNTIAGYVYDDAAVEFTLCVESESGAWATYDTAPMTLRENGATGGCPFG